jgi:hypothetical protein
MNKLRVLFGFISLMWVSACTDFVEPAIPYSDFETGVFLRTLVNLNLQLSISLTYQIKSLILLLKQ